jgi:membrane-associated phospholipid phosphatase
MTAARHVTLLLAASAVLAGPPALGDSVEDSGHVLRVAIPVVAYGVAWRREDDEGKRQFLKAFAGTVATTVALKAAIDKERPNGEDDDAFPSGHAATAFAGAAFLHRRYGWREAWPAYALSAYVGWTRVDADEHEWEDVLGGAAVAIGWNWWLVEPRDGVALVPIVDGDRVGLTVQKRW